MEVEQLQHPFFSIVIPVYNRFELVQDTIKSIFNQTFRNFEIIIVDDGSTDGSGSKLDDLYSGDDRIKIIHQENKERGASRNTGFLSSKGKYVVFLDSDDMLLPNHLEVLNDKITALNNPAFIATKYEFLSDGKRKATSLNNLKEGYYDYTLFLEGNPFGCNVCVRRHNEKLFLFEEDRKLAIKEDWLFFIKNLRHQKLYLIDAVTLLMLDHEDRSMRGNNDVLVAKTKMALEWIKNNVELSPLEQRKLRAHTNYFCAIHKYLDADKFQALGFVMNAIREAGPRKKYMVLLGKILVGRKMILRLFHGS